MGNSNDIKSALIDVRKAYRLLYEYQKRVLDLIDYIGRKYGFSYDGGWAKFCNNAPRNGKGLLTNWAWDWLPFYFYEFHFNDKKQEEDIIHFSIVILSDSGYFDKRDKENAPNFNQLNVQDFYPVENSKTELIFVAAKNKWPLDWYSENFVSRQEGSEKDDKGIIVFKHFLLEDFINQEKTDKTLSAFSLYCQEFEIPLNYNNNENNRNNSTLLQRK